MFWKVKEKLVAESVALNPKTQPYELVNECVFEFCTTISVPVVMSSCE